MDQLVWPIEPEIRHQPGPKKLLKLGKTDQNWKKQEIGGKSGFIKKTNWFIYKAYGKKFESVTFLINNNLIFFFSLSIKYVHDFALDWCDLLYNTNLL